MVRPNYINDHFLSSS